ncbi:hypothetical protein B0H14DRAFT_3610853 [Mycena olivaceomarginata]|nr:hypothetical protein B0H14DRAFT_3610853 [Mycena olivaceomarginata]
MATTMYGPSGPVLDAIWQKDVQQPGESHLPQTHPNKEGCMKAQAKKDKQPRRNGSLSSFFKEKAAPIAKFLKPTVRAPSPIRGITVATTHPSISAAPSISPSSVTPTMNPRPPSSRAHQLLDQLRASVELLPSTLPHADQENPLSEFAGQPTQYVSQNTPAGELWEELAPHFHRVFGYGMKLEDRIPMIQRGMSGLDGALRFLDYFICERGLEGGMVEVKIEQLIEAVQFVLQEKGIARSGASNPLTTPSPLHHPVIDVDAMDVDMELPSETPPPAASRHSKKSPSCAGYVFPFKVDQTASSDYPFKLHDTSNPPWEYNGNNAGGILHRAAEGIPESANYSFNPISGLIEHIHRKNGQIKRLRLRGLNAVKRIAAQARSLTDHKRFVRAIGSGKVENVDRLVRVQLGRKQGIRGLLSTYDDAAKGVYGHKSYTEEDDLRGVLLWKMAGNRVADFAHRALGLPSRTTLRKRATVPPIVPSPGRPQATEVAENVEACFKGITDVLAAKKPQHAVLMFDEIATERRIRWDPRTNNFLGVCRQHADKASLQFNGEKDLEELFRAKEEGKVHFAGEATVGAIGMLTDETRLYAARPVLISADCKKESGREHLRNVLDPTIDGVNSTKNLTGLRIVSVPSDGETRRGKAFVEISIVDFWVGEDDLTGEKDYKHDFKRGRNRLVRALGMKVFGIQITPAILRVHFQSAGLSTQHIHAILNPDDKQDVKLAFDLLKDIWSLPPAPADARPGFAAAREAARIIGSLFYHLLFPYVCVDLSLTEQLEHLSAAAHLLLILYRDGGKDAIAVGALYSDDMMDGFYHENRVFTSMNQEAAKTFKSLVSSPDFGRERPIRVLEVGAGVGGLTKFLVEALCDMPNADVEYTVTDLSYSLANSLAQSFTYKNMVAKMYDLAKTAAEQGLQLGHYDLITGLNVIHAVPELDATLRDLHTLLAPGGRPLIVDTDGTARSSSPPRPGAIWNDFIWGSFQGWFGYTDDRTHCTIDEKQWRRRLAATGYSNIKLCVSGLPFNNVGTAAAQHLVVALAGVKHAADLVLISVHENAASEPRPDLLHHLTFAIREGTNLAADWTTGTGCDRSRIVNYKMQSKADAETMEALLKKYLKEHNINVFSDVDELCKGEITVKGRSLACTSPRFVLPRYGWDLVLNRCQSLQNFQASMDHAMTQALGHNCILSSYMDLDGDVYGVILRNWEDVQKLQNMTTPQPARLPPFHTLTSYSLYHEHLVTLLVETLAEAQSSRARTFSGKFTCKQYAQFLLESTLFIAVVAAYGSV